MSQRPLKSPESSRREPADPQRERRVLELFERALEVEPKRRPGFLDEACGRDGDLRSRVESLLSEHAGLASFLDVNAEDAAAASSDAIAALLSGRPEFAKLFEASAGGDEESLAGPPPAGLGRLASGEARYVRPTEIARGGMGVIYRIWDVVLRRALAMKVSRRRGARSASDPGSPADLRELARFLEEAQITGQLDHPGVVPLHDIGLDSEGRVFFTMRLVQGLDLGTVFKLAREGREGWNETRALGILARVCETIAYAHSKNVIHRDLKPTNVMVGRYGETYVMDWGLAKVVGREDGRDLRLREPEAGPGAVVSTARSDEDKSEQSPLMTMDGAVVGTPAFMPPEQAEGRVGELDARSDVYAVGAMLYMLVAGRMPFTEPGSPASPRKVLEAVRRGPPRPLHEIATGAPVELIAICEKAMARAKTARYSTMDELAEDLRAYLENRVVRAHRTGAVMELRKWVARNRATASLVGAIFVLLVAGLAVSLQLLQTVWYETKAKEEALGRVGQEASAKGEALVERSKALARAEGTRLAAQSAAFLATDPGQALLQAIEAARLDPGYRANSALAAALGELREERTLLGHGTEITGVLFNPDGRRVVTASRDNTVRVWDAGTGEEMLRFHGHLWAPEGLVQDSTGRLVASFGWDQSARLWDVDAGRFLHVLEHPKMDPHPNVVYGAAFSPDGRYLLTVAYDGVGRIWNVMKGSLEVELRGHKPEKLASGKFSHDGQRVVTASHDGTARVWNASNGETLQVLEGHRASLVSADFNPDGRLVVTASMDDTACVWEWATRRQVWVLKGHERWLTGASFSPDGSRILTTSNDGTARLWDPATGQALAVLRGHGDAVNGGCFSADGRRVLTCSEDRTARLWDVSSGREVAVLRGHQSAVLTASFSRDGRRAVTASKDNSARVWNADSDLESARLIRPRWDRWTIFSPDGSSALVFGSDRAAQIRNAASGELKVTLSGHEGGVLTAAFSQDGARVATASLDLTARVWDSANGRDLASLAGHDRAVVAVAFDPTGTVLATGSADHTAVLWEVSTSKLLQRLKGHGHWVNSVDFSPDGSLLATASDDSTAGLWRVATGELVRRLRHPTGWLHAARFSRDGRLLLTASKMNLMFLWDVASGKLITRLVGHDADYEGAAFDPACARLVTLHASGAAHVWDLPAGQRLLTVLVPGERFRAAGFGEDGHSLWTEGADGARRTWPLDPLAAALARCPRVLTPYDRVRIDLGTDQERKAQNLEWERWAFLQTVGVAEHSWENDPAHREALNLHAREIRQAFAWIHKDVGLLASAAPPGDAPSGHASYASLWRRALGILERTAGLPGAPPEVSEWVKATQRELLPDLLSYGSVDAALAGLDRAALIEPGARWRLFRGIREPSAGRAWTAVGFDDSTWEDVALPIGRGGSSGAAKTVIGDMPAGCSTVYARRRFSVDDPRRWRRIRLSVLNDDGFIVYLNGYELYRARAGVVRTPVAYDARALSSVRGQPVKNLVTVSAERLQKGENVIAIHLLDAVDGEDDLFLGATVAGEAVCEAGRERDLVRPVENAAAGNAPPGSVVLPQRYLEGRRFQRREKPLEAARIFQDLRREDPRSLEPLCRLVECLRAAGKGQEADEILRTSLASEPSFPADDLEKLKRDTWSVVRLCDEDLEDYYRAFRWAERAHALREPVQADTLTAIGIARYRLGLYKEALETLRSSRALYALSHGGEGNAQNIAFLAMTCYRLGMAEDARRQFLDLRDPAKNEGARGPYLTEAAWLIGVPLVEEKGLSATSPRPSSP